MAARTPPRREEYRHVQPVTSRWMDNDVYGHVNNAHYYSFFDTVANRYLVEAGGLDSHRGAAVRYAVALFRAGDPVARAAGFMVHVFVDRASSQPTPIPEGVRAALARIVA